MGIRVAECRVYAWGARDGGNAGAGKPNRPAEHCFQIRTQVQPGEGHFGAREGAIGIAVSMAAIVTC